MKKVITLFAILMVVVSCGTAKKVNNATNKVEVDSSFIAKQSEKHVDKIVDTSLTDKGKITITEIEFFPPVEKPKESADTTTSPDAETSVIPSVQVEMDNFGDVKGSVKSIKQTVIEKNTERKGESKESDTQKETESEALVQKNDINETKIQEPTKDPLHWRYVFYTSLLGLAVIIILYVKRKPILNFIRTILSHLRRLFGK